MYARKQIFLAVGILLISIMILCFIRYSRKTDIYSVLGFTDMTEDTMHIKRLKWDEKRQLLNAP
jgi:hypothetical protein